MALGPDAAEGLQSIAYSTNPLSSIFEVINLNHHREGDSTERRHEEIRGVQGSGLCWKLCVLFHIFLPCLLILAASGPIRPVQAPTSFTQVRSVP